MGLRARLKLMYGSFYEFKAVGVQSFEFFGGSCICKRSHVTSVEILTRIMLKLVLDSSLPLFNFSEFACELLSPGLAFLLEKHGALGGGGTIEHYLTTIICCFYRCSIVFYYLLPLPPPLLQKVSWKNCHYFSYGGKDLSVSGVERVSSRKRFRDVSWTRVINLQLYCLFF